MQRREFLKQLASGLLVVTASPIVDPTRKVFRMGVALPPPDLVWRMLLGLSHRDYMLDGVRVGCVKVPRGATASEIEALLFRLGAEPMPTRKWMLATTGD